MAGRFNNAHAVMAGDERLYVGVIWVSDASLFLNPSSCETGNNYYK